MLVAVFTSATVAAPMRPPAASETVPRMAPVEPSWARAVVNGRPETSIRQKKTRQRKLDIRARTCRQSKLVNESRPEKGTRWVYHRRWHVSVTDELSF